jgi:uncharacterized protein (DUF1800 family)
MQPIKASLGLMLSTLLSLPSSAFAQSPLAQTSAPRKSYQSSELQGDERILQALNRFTFGVRPGDVDAVRSMGLERWFDQQLHPATINNADLDARLAQFPAMRWSVEDLLVRLPSNGVIRQASDGKIAVPAGGALHSVYENEIARYENRQAKKQEKNQPQLPAAKATMASLTSSGHASSNTQRMSGVLVAGQLMSDGSISAPTTGATSDARSAAGSSIESEQMMSTPDMRSEQDARREPPVPDPAQIARLLALPPAQRVARMVAMQQPEFDSYRKALKGPQHSTLIADLNPAQKEVVLALEAPQRVVNEELMAQRLTRDIYSNAQLQEVMTDFWLNHFNVFLHKNDETPYYVVSYERDVIRPRALGKFEDILEATAHSPAMLLYLDNSSSTGPDSPAAQKAKLSAARRPDAKKAAPQGLNENYARELMELHTLGVNGGYTQADVTQVARVLTGWTVDKPQRGGGFKFDESRHEPGNKKVLGKKIKDNGEKEGEELLHLLASRPATAKFISRKLAIRFVGDEPPQALVDRMAKTYLSTGGDISSVLRTLFHSPEFWSSSDYRAKVKTPLEFVTSAARVTGADVDNLQPLTNALHDMGMPLYGAVPPTGYKWDASDWVSTGALVDRLNFALRLAGNKLPGITITWSPQTGPLVAAIDNGSSPNSPVQSLAAGYLPGTMPTPQAEEQRLESFLVDGGVSTSTRAAVLDQFNQQTQTQNTTNSATLTTTAKPMNPTQAAAALERQDQLLAGLLLGSPEFQRR